MTGRPSSEPRVLSRFGILETLADAFRGAFLLLAIGLVFGQTRHQEFINLDDNMGVYENRWVTQGLQPGSLHWAFTNRLNENWCPLTWISHIADWHLYGKDAGGHHLTNVLLHAATALSAVSRPAANDRPPWPSALAAALLAIHPLAGGIGGLGDGTKRRPERNVLHVDAWAYVGYVRRRFARCVRYLAVMVLFALGLMSKPMLVTLPCVLLLLDYWPLDGWLGPPRGLRRAPSRLSRRFSKKSRCWRCRLVSLHGDRLGGARDGISNSRAGVADWQRFDLLRRLSAAVLLADGFGDAVSASGA